VTSVPAGQPQFDVVVLGTGAAGLVAAIAAAEGGASVGLFEKADRVGGTTAISGGGCWVPCSAQMAASGIADSRDDALRYLVSLSFGHIRPGFAETFIDEGPRVFQRLQSAAGLRMKIVSGYPDYHPERPGGKPGGGRTLEPELFSFRQLGGWADRVVSSHRNPHLMLSDTTLGGGTGHLDEKIRAQRHEEDLRGCGAALVGPLLRACLDRGIEPVTASRAHDLVIDDGRVAGVIVEQPAGTVIVHADRGVVLATGGFEWDPELVRGFLRGPMTSPASIPTNVGDGLLMAMRAGAALDNMPQAWWAPVIEIPGDMSFGRQHATLLNRERTLPRSILVNKLGRRFANEAANYNALGGAFHQLDTTRFDYANLPCWLVFDAGYLARYGFRDVRPADPAPAWMTRADSLGGLAAAIGAPAEALTETVTRWNSNVESGDDQDFHRGRSAYDLWSGDAAARGTVDSTLGPIDKPPYYAIEVRSGTLGTSGGARADLHGRVLDTRGKVIPGLFAAGNVAAAPTGMVYGGAGGTLGPIITFACRAGMAASRPGDFR
jgi:succinate dehydrogenase/fumarate reductase flavoprotein subunit